MLEIAGSPTGSPVGDAIHRLVEFAYAEEIVGGVAAEKAAYAAAMSSLVSAILIQAKMDAADLIAMNVYPSARRQG